MAETVAIRNSCGLCINCIRVGASITSLVLPNGTDIVLGFKNHDDYRTNSPYIGSVVGRVTNRIIGASFTLDDQEHHLTPNEAPNHLHGGAVGFNKIIWDLKSHSETRAVFEHVSPAGTEGYPGTLTCTVTYDISEENEVHLNFRAVTDTSTIVSMTSHTYFNLAGKGSILDHILHIPSEQTTDLDGEVHLVAGKATDFQTPTKIGEKMTGTAVGGFDCNYSLLNIDKTHDAHTQLHLCAMLEDPVTGNKVEVFSDQPGVQLYTGNFLDGSYAGKDGAPIEKHHGVCLETQAWPNAINIEGASKQVILRPGDEYIAKTVWKLSWKR